MKYTCPKHGAMGGYVGILVQIGGDQPPPGLVPYIGERKYCMACWLDHLDRTTYRLEEHDDSGNLVLS